jgi:uncharacterized membrane protein YobD (UPF0266 family)
MIKSSYENNNSTVQLDLLKLETISFWDEYLTSLKANIKKTQQYFEENQINFSAVDKWELRRTLDEGECLVSLLEKKKLLIPNAQTIYELKNQHTSLKRYVGRSKKRASRTIFEELTEILFRCRSES